MLSATPARSRLSALVLLLVTAFGSVAVATPAEAATTLSSRVVAEAAKHKGKAYQYGAVGPRRFDCSGYTLYVYRQFGKRLPHSSREQYNVTRHLRKADKRPGDLIFFYSSSGRIYHVGIYAGNGKIWHSPRSGSYVKLAPIWSSSYKVGRVR